MLKIYIYWYKCWCHRCGTGRTTSEDRATQLFICEPLSFAISNALRESRFLIADCPVMSFVFVCWQINTRNTNPLSWVIKHHKSTGGTKFSYTSVLPWHARVGQQQSLYSCNRSHNRDMESCKNALFWFCIKMNHFFSDALTYPVSAVLAWSLGFELANISFLLSRMQEQET